MKNMPYITVTSCSRVEHSSMKKAVAFAKEHVSLFVEIKLNQPTETRTVAYKLSGSTRVCRKFSGY